MKHSLETHLAAIEKLAADHGKAAAGLEARSVAAQSKIAVFLNAPTPGGLGDALTAQIEQAALERLAAALPDAEHHAAQLRDGYVVQNRDELLALLQSDLAARLAKKAAWRSPRAKEIAAIAEKLALGELPPADLAAAERRRDEIEADLAAADGREHGVRAALAAFRSSPDFTAFADARGFIFGVKF